MIKKGFTLIELMIVIAIVGILTMSAFNFDFNKRTDIEKRDRFVEKINSMMHSNNIAITSGKGIKFGPNIINPTSIQMVFSNSAIITNYYSGTEIIGVGESLQSPFFGESGYNLNNFHYINKDNSTGAISNYFTVIYDSNGDITFTGSDVGIDTSVMIGMNIGYNENKYSVKFDRRFGKFLTDTSVTDSGLIISENFTTCPSGQTWDGVNCVTIYTIIDCIGSWNNTTACSNTCGGGVLEQVYQITTTALNGGISCPFIDGATQWGTTSCNTQACPVNGVCNNSVQFACTSGASTSNVAGSCGGSATWSCNGSNGGTNATCSKANAACPVNGVCNNSVQFACTSGASTSNVAGSCGGSATWSCNGSNGGTNATCSKANAACPVNGVCNNSVQFACTSGASTSNVAGSCGGSATWSCNGSNGGTNATCSKANAACAPTKMCYYNYSPGICIGMYLGPCSTIADCAPTYYMGNCITGQFGYAPLQGCYQ